MAFVKTKIHLDQCKNGEIIQILYEDTAANESLARSITALGHRILPENLDTASKDFAKTYPLTFNHPRISTLQLKRIRLQVKK